MRTKNMKDGGKERGMSRRFTAQSILGCIWLYALQFHSSNRKLYAPQSEYISLRLSPLLSIGPSHVVLLVLGTWQRWCSCCSLTFLPFACLPLHHHQPFHFCRATLLLLLLPRWECKQKAKSPANTSAMPSTQVQYTVYRILLTFLPPPSSQRGKGYHDNHPLLMLQLGWMTRKRACKKGLLLHNTCEYSLVLTPHFTVLYATYTYSTYTAQYMWKRALYDSRPISFSLRFFLHKCPILNSAYT